MEFIEFMREFNTVTVAARILLAALLGGIVGIERGKQGRAAGMRTHIFVSVGSALTAMIGFFVNTQLGYDGDPMRISAQVISGIGFLGVGTILIKGRFQITGLTTAAGLWATAAIGLALGVGFYEGALITFAVAIITVTLLHRLESKLLRRQRRFGIYVEIDSDKAVRAAIDHLSLTYSATDIQVTSPRSGTAGNVGIEANISSPSNSTEPNVMARELEVLDFVVFAIESI